MKISHVMKELKTPIDNPELKVSVGATLTFNGELPKGWEVNEELEHLDKHK